MLDTPSLQAMDIEDTVKSRRCIFLNAKSTANVNTICFIFGAQHLCLLYHLKTADMAAWDTLITLIHIRPRCVLCRGKTETTDQDDPSHNHGDQDDTANTSYMGRRTKCICKLNEL